MNQKPSKTQPRAAVALSYDERSMSAPRVSARGKRLLVDEMRKVARRYGVPVHYDPELTEKIDCVEENQQIPPEMYREIADLFIKLDKQRK